MRYKVIIRQERPTYTRAPFHSRMWELYVMNRISKKYEYYAFTLTFEDALALAEKVWAKSNNVNPLALKEATC